MNKKYNKIINLVIIIICLLGILLCAAWLINYYLEGQNAKQHVEDIKVTYITSEPIATATPVPTEKPVYEAPTAEPPTGVVIDGVEYADFEGMQVPVRNIDFEGLHQDENEHIYAWIYIPNTNIDYPIVQHPEDANFYLRRDLKGNNATAGCIFTQFYNSMDFNDNNTVLYGHNMRNQTMFATLHNYEDKSFFAENPYVYIYTEYDTRVYQVFAEYEYSDKHIVLSYDFKDDNVFGEYLAEIKGISEEQDYNNYNWDIGVTQDDKIITLSTCVRGQDTSRYLVQAKLVAVEPGTDAED